jgi:hypothetical protein
MDVSYTHWCEKDEINWILQGHPISEISSENCVSQQIPVLQPHRLLPFCIKATSHWKFLLTCLVPLQLPVSPHWPAEANLVHRVAPSSRHCRCQETKAKNKKGKSTDWLLLLLMNYDRLKQRMSLVRQGKRILLNFKAFQLNTEFMQ